MRTLIVEFLLALAFAVFLGMAVAPDWTVDTLEAVWAYVRILARY